MVIVINEETIRSCVVSRVFMDCNYCTLEFVILSTDYRWKITLVFYCELFRWK